MPKNKGKGGKNRRRGKGGNSEFSRELVQKVEGQDYAQVKKSLGSLHVEALCSDGKTRMCVVPGHMKRRQWVNLGDIILVNLRDYQDDKADISLRYTPTEVRSLKKMGVLPSIMNMDEVQDDGEDKFEFTGEKEETDDVDASLAQPSIVGMLPPLDDEVDLDDL